MNRLIRGVKLLIYVFLLSTIFSAIFLLPYLFYRQSGDEAYLIVYILHFFVVSYLLGVDSD
jgi:hypothetical protein